MTNELDKLMLATGSDKASKDHDYCRFYEPLFRDMRDQELVILELGVGGEDKELGGLSLLAWEKYFLNAKIYGIDIYDKSALNKGRIKTFMGSQTDPDFLIEVLNEIGVPDIIIDDASHINANTIRTFQLLFPHLKKGGIYVIEDTLCSYRWDFGGVKDVHDCNAPTIMNYLFSMAHDMHPMQFADQDYKHIEDFRDVESLQFSNDLAIIKKKP